MNDWLIEYKNAAYRTRWIGITGAILMLAAIGWELFSLYAAVSVAEAHFQGDYAEYVWYLAWMFALISVAFIVRVIFLVVFKPERYSWVAFSWLLSFASVVFYLWQILPGPTTSCGEEGRCFTIYYHSSADWGGLPASVLLYSVWFEQ